MADVGRAARNQHEDGQATGENAEAGEEGDDDGGRHEHDHGGVDGGCRDMEDPCG